MNRRPVSLADPDYRKMLFGFSTRFETPSVMLRDNQLTISYHANGGHQVYQGSGTHGHWDLHNAQTGGWSSAHRIPESETIEGLWHEGSLSGYWKVRLVRRVNQ